jgi:formylglycine-generating enzyme required for sulfatase activity
MTMWDQGTGDPGMPWPEAIAALMAEIGADTAQGTDGRLYPWGNGWDDSAVPVPDKSRTLRGPDLVGGHLQGAGPLGVMDMVGNVGQWRVEGGVRRRAHSRWHSPRR